MKKISIEEIKKAFESEPIDYTDTAKLAEDCWLFLTDDKLPARANIKKAAFLHEVKCMIESAILFNQPKECYAVYSGCIYEGGGVDSLWTTKELAIEKATEMFNKKQDEAKKIWKRNKEFWWKVVKREKYWHENLIAIWNNCVDEIKVIRYSLNPSPNSDQNVQGCDATEFQ